ncbi:hypothetical protein CCOS865_02085 [Pseudomonas reidholzensis]|uniref:Uncharacterized protein n=1 Tax=Pseudomonas reidholzensis TaxID=1785162 RepID=A0A383RT56_9PSED|nr:hypothetical protein CCOS865_02085 [Pseudomonas reidholzensis]
METFNRSAVALQKNLLTLRQQRDRSRAMGDDQRAEDLQRMIARIEAALATLQGAFEPPTLQ